MRTYLLFLSLCWIVLTSTSAKNIYVTIRDQDSEMPLLGLYITCMNLLDTSYTIPEEDVTFRLMDMPSGRYNIGVSYLGYKNRTIPNVLVDSAKETILTLKLEETVIIMDEVAVIARKERSTGYLRQFGISPNLMYRIYL